MEPAVVHRPRPKEADGAMDPDCIAVRVQAELGSRVRDFEVVSGPDGLILRCRTSTYYAKQLAQHVVMRLSRVQVVTNEINVS